MASSSKKGKHVLWIDAIPIGVVGKDANRGTLQARKDLVDGFQR